MYPVFSQSFNTDEKYKNVYDKLKSRNVQAKYKDFKLTNNDEIIHVPTNKTVIKKQDVNNVLEEIYKNDNNLLSKGVQSFHKYITQRYINISRKDVEKFLKSQANYQLSYSIQTQVNKPIIEKYSNARWQVDLIDLSNYSSSNFNYRYLLNCIDVFSRKIWLRKMKTKEADECGRVLKSILNEAGVKPKIIQTDSGGEFLGAEFEELLNEEGIKHIKNESYKPNQNALVERSNQNVRKVIRAFFIQNNNTRWYNILPDIEENINNQFVSSIKASPNQIWSATNEKLTTRSFPKSFDANPKLVTVYNTFETAKEKIKKSKKNDNFSVGDYVRIKMSTLFANIRRELKAGNSKTIVVTYSPIKFKIKQIISGNLIQRNRYICETENSDGVLVTSATRKPKQFYSSDLLLVNSDDKDLIDMDRALELNKIERNENDVGILDY